MKARYSLRFFARRHFAGDVTGVPAGMILVVCTALVACGSGAERRDRVAAKNDKLARYVERLRVPPVEDKMLLVIPTTGCGPCIQEALEFTAKHEESTKLSVVVSGRGKRFRTLLVSKFGVDTARVVFDKDALAAQWGLITIYPTLFRLGDHGKIDSTALTGRTAHQVLADLGPLVE